MSSIYEHFFQTEGEVYSFGNQSRGRLGRPEEDPTEPRKVPFVGEDPFIVVSLSCSHGNTLLATRRMFILTYLNISVFSISFLLRK
jgi:alpha-tubulin suppressor-like RCC1 family protein